MVKKNYLIPTSTNYKKTSGRIFQNKLNNYNNLSGQNNSSKNKNNNFTQNTKSSFSANNNDNSKDNNDIDNNFNSSNKKEKDNDQVNIYEESIDAKERELNKYRSEIDNIIANYKSKQNINKTNLLNKYGFVSLPETRNHDHWTQQQKPDLPRAFEWSTRSLLLWLLHIPLFA